MIILQEAKMQKRQECWNMLGGNDKSNATKKTNNTTRRNKSEVTCERRKIKNISRQDKTIQTNRTFQNNEKNVQPASSSGMHDDIQATRWQNDKTI